MRIIAGRFKNLSLKVPKGIGLRPTSQKLKESLFDILGAAVSGASFLDLFAGSGNIGIEALSRGAKEVVLVENNRLCIQTIRANLNRLKVACQFGLQRAENNPEVPVTVLPFSVERALSLLEKAGRRFDFIFLDPPYNQKELKNYLIKISDCDILNVHYYLIAEHSKRQDLPQISGRLKLSLRRIYGDSVFSFYKIR